ncbi:MAG: DMT family transporter [Bryobacteraceae bacterium]
MTRSRIAALAAAVIFSTGGAAIKWTHLSGWQVAGFRSIVAAAALLALIPEIRRGWNWRMGVVGAAYSGTLILFVIATKLTTAANAIFLQSTGPLYLFLIGPWLLKERPRPRDYVFMAALLAGLLACFVVQDAPAGTAPDPVRGNVLGALCGVCWGFTIAGLRWIGTRSSEGDPALATVAAGNLIAFVVSLPQALPVVGATASDWATIAYLGVIQIGLAYWLLTRAVKRLPALETSMLLLLEPALNPVWAWVAHGERPGVWTLAGGVLIIGATALTLTTAPQRSDER